MKVEPVVNKVLREKRISGKQEYQKMIENEVGKTQQKVVGNHSYSLGRTISLGSYQFARIEVSVEFDEMIENFDTVGKELLRRELMSWSTETVEKKDVSKEMKQMQLIAVRISYGLTVSLKKFESAKVDVSSRRVISIETAEEQIEQLQKELAGLLEEEQSRMSSLSNAKDDLGL